MQRIIKFKAKRIDNNEWVIGVPYPIQQENKCFIINNCKSLNFTKEDTTFEGIEVNPETICQLLNCGSGDFYENDKAIYKGKEYIVEFNLSYATLERCSSIHGENETIFIDEDVAYLMKIIGNIHD